MTLRAILYLSILVASGAAPLPASAQVSCGDTIPARAKVVLTGSLGPCLNVTAVTLESGARLDLAGFTVSCSGASSAGILLTGKGAQLKNGLVTGCNLFGVHLAGEGRHRVESVVTDGGEGFLINSDSNKIERSAVLLAGAGYLVFGNKNSLNDTSAFATGSYGYDIQGSGNKLNGAAVSESSNTGIRIQGDANKISGASITSSANHGIEVKAGVRNQIQKARVADSVQHGIRILAGSFGTRVKDCVALANALDITVEVANCGTTTFQKNVFGSGISAGMSNECIR